MILLKHHPSFVWLAYLKCWFFSLAVNSCKPAESSQDLRACAQLGSACFYLKVSYEGVMAILSFLSAVNSCKPAESSQALRACAQLGSACFYYYVYFIKTDPQNFISIKDGSKFPYLLPLGIIKRYLISTEIYIWSILSNNIKMLEASWHQTKGAMLV